MNRYLKNQNTKKQFTQQQHKRVPSIKISFKIILINLNQHLSF